MDVDGDSSAVDFELSCNIMTGTATLAKRGPLRAEQHTESVETNTNVTLT